MSTQIGRGHIVGLSGGTITFTNPDTTTLAGTILYDERSLRVSHNGSVTNIKNKSGETVGLIAVDEMLECTFNFIPYGTSVANAKASATAPDLLASAVITGLPVIPMGSFSDALNASSGNPWIYEGGWEVNGTGDGEPWSASVTLKRYPGITSGTAIS
jgi:hypothetical protein